MSNSKTPQKPGFRLKQQPRSIRNRVKTTIDPSEYTSSYKSAEQQDPVDVISKVRKAGIHKLDMTIEYVLSRNEQQQPYERELVTRWEEKEVLGAMGAGDFSSEEYHKSLENEVNRLNYWGDNWDKDLHEDNKQTGCDAFYKIFWKLMEMHIPDAPNDLPRIEAHSNEVSFPMPFFTDPDIYDSQFATYGSSALPNLENTLEPPIYQVHDAVSISEMSEGAKYGSEDPFADELLELAGYADAYQEGAGDYTYHESDGQHNSVGYASSGALYDPFDISLNLLENATDTMIYPPWPYPMEQGNGELFPVDFDYSVNSQNAPDWEFGEPFPTSAQLDPSLGDYNFMNPGISYQDNGVTVFETAPTETGEPFNMYIEDVPDAFTYGVDTAGLSPQAQMWPTQSSFPALPTHDLQFASNEENANQMDWEEQQSTTTFLHAPQIGQPAQDTGISQDFLENTEIVGTTDDLFVPASSNTTSMKEQIEAEETVPNACSDSMVFESTATEKSEVFLDFDAPGSNQQNLFAVQASTAAENPFKRKEFAEAAADTSRPSFFTSIATAPTPDPVSAMPTFIWPPEDKPSATVPRPACKAMFAYDRKPADTASEPATSKTSPLFGDVTLVLGVPSNLASSKPIVPATFDFGDANTAEPTVFGAQPIPTQQESRSIGKIAIRICRFINEWEAQTDKYFPEALCGSVEDLVDAYRYMDRTDSGRTLKDVRQLHNQWVSMRKVIKAYENLALSFDPLAREEFEHLHQAATLAPNGSPQQESLNAKLKQKLDTMIKRYWEFLEVAQELYNRAPDLMQRGLKEWVKATLNECCVILERVHMVLQIPLPGVVATTVNDDDEL